MNGGENHLHSTNRPASGSFALLRFGQLEVAVPQGDLRVLDLAVDVDRNDPPAHGIGWIEFRGQKGPVYFPSERLEWLTASPEARSICAVLSAEGQIFGLMCADTLLAKPGEIAFHPVPPAMAAHGAPFHGLAVRGETLVCLSSAERLFHYLPQETVGSDSVLAEAP